jgi:hypothetical protein
MPNEVRKFWLGVFILAVAIYIGENPNGLLAGLPLVRLFTGGVFLSAISLCMVEAGWRIATPSASNGLDKVIGIIFLIVGLALLIGSIYGAYNHNRFDVVLAAVIGAVFYFLLIRWPVAALYKG